MNARKLSQVRQLFDSIINATTQINEEVVIRHLSKIAWADVDTTNPDTVTIAHLHNALVDEEHNNMTPLMAAAKVGSERVARCLIDLITFYHTNIACQPFNFDVPDKNGTTAIMYAAESGYLHIVQLLLATNACDPTIRNMKWKNAATLAHDASHAAVAKFLQDTNKSIEKERNRFFAEIASRMNTSIGNAKNTDVLHNAAEPGLKKSRSKK